LRHSEVALPERLPQSVRLENGKHRQREARAHPGDGLQQDEQLAGRGIGEAIQRQRVLAHHQRRGEPGLFAAAQGGQGGWNRMHRQADTAANLDDGMVQLDREHLPAHRGDHRAAPA